MTTYTSGITTITIGTAGTYQITAAGAQGGASGNGVAGGLGATASGDIYLAKGAKLEIVVGAQGGVGGIASGNGGGGGGGSYVIETYDGTKAVDVNEVIAGGGGGGGFTFGNSGAGGTTNGSGAVGQGGANGGGGGGGFTGGTGGGTGGTGGTGSNAGTSFAGGPGASGTSFVGSSITGGNGGLGGGGGGGYSGGGGGGGYGGGNGGNGNSSPSGGGGGGSHVNPDATSATQTAADRPGDGVVDIALLCFAAGTLIATERGNIAVERLAVGDRVVTASGALRPIRWLGHRTIACAAQTRPSECWPVRIRAGAFGPNLPARTLYLSPGHPVLVGADDDNAGGVLAPIMCLINGTTIDRVPCDSVTYWHVELEAHDILLAEGLPAESYIDLGSRPWFAGADGALYDPDLALPGQPGRCRSVAIDGPVVEAERRRLDMLFATRLIEAAAWPAIEDALAL